MMAFDACMKVGGDARLVPYQPVDINLKEKNISGVWIVKEVTHLLVEGNYTADVVVSTDSYDGGPSTVFTPGPLFAISLPSRQVMRDPILHTRLDFVQYKLVRSWGKPRWETNTHGLPVKMSGEE
jgi:hypothetical protein